jgi:membrane-associated phospholipid phosphatase
VALSAAAGALTFALALDSPPTDPRWRGGILFDDAVRRGLRLDSASARRTARSIGDLPYYLSGALPLVLDPVVAWGIHGDSRAAANIELMGLEAFSYTGLLSFVSTRVSVRERPDTTECRGPHRDGAGCENDTQAFWSGHTSIVAASAGLVCANHRYLALWGHPWADAGACVLASSGVLITALSRLVADRHYASDVIVGTGVGFAFGYGVPILLHYGKSVPPVRVGFRSDAWGGGAMLELSGEL